MDSQDALREGKTKPDRQPRWEQRKTPPTKRLKSLATRYQPKYENRR